jgi:GrpB-like predicted nucleotidyltransferase (UPF0157 family)
MTIHQILQYDSPPVACNPYDSQAAEVARILIELIRGEVQDVEVEHIGSTSVPGCAGKGHIDLMVLYSEGAIEATKAGLAALGFQPQTSRDPFPEERPMRVGRIAYGGKDYPVHVHVIAMNAPEVEALRWFKEMLKADARLREEYVEVKKGILAAGISDSVEYCISKSAFVERVLAKGKADASPSARSNKDWKQQAKVIFDGPKPAHFVDYRHCCECAEHDETLSRFDVDSIDLQQLGNPGWDPLCFSSSEGLIYYMPALIRLTLDTIDKPQHRYLDQMLFHLIKDGADNMLVSACSKEQREFIADFLEYLMDDYCAQIDDGVFTSDDILRVHEIWSH